MFCSCLLQSLGILASIPAAILIVALVGLLLYLLTRCCDRKQRKSKSQTCQNCTLITTTLLCCGAIGLGIHINFDLNGSYNSIIYNCSPGLYGNDDFHNGVLQAFSSGRQIKTLVFNFTNRVRTYIVLFSAVLILIVGINWLIKIYRLSGSNTKFGQRF